MRRPLFDVEIGKPSRRQQTADLLILVAGASGLRNADWFSLAGNKSDPYCKCQIEGMPAESFRTAVLQNDLDPVWEHVERVYEYPVGQAITFEVCDQDHPVKKDDDLGFVRLEAEEFFPHGFAGRLPLEQRASKTAASYIDVMITRLPLMSGILQFQPADGPAYRRFCELWPQGLLQAPGLTQPRQSRLVESIAVQALESVCMEDENSITLSMCDPAAPVKIAACQAADTQRWCQGLRRCLLLPGDAPRGDGVETAKADPQRVAFKRFDRPPLAECTVKVVHGQLKDTTVFFVLTGKSAFYWLTTEARSHSKRASGVSGVGDPSGRRSSIAQGAGFVGMKVPPAGKFNVADVQTVHVNHTGRIVIELVSSGKCTLQARTWTETLQLGRAWRSALRMAGAPGRIQWATFENCPVTHGQVKLCRTESHTEDKYAVLFPDRLSIFDSNVAWHRGQEEGWVLLADISDITVGSNDFEVVVATSQGQKVQFHVLGEETANRWAEAFTEVLRYQQSEVLVRTVGGLPHAPLDWSRGEVL